MPALQRTRETWPAITTLEAQLTDRVSHNGATIYPLVVWLSRRGGRANGDILGHAAGAW